jgi:hypothetical protein
MPLIGDHERERAAAMLRAHYVRGRLTVDELADRLDLALTARRTNDVGVALAGLPSRPAWETFWLRARRTAFAMAVWTLWWLASLALLLGFVAAVVLQGLTLTNAILFPALWLAATFAARHVTRRHL